MKNYRQGNQDFLVKMEGKPYRGGGGEVGGGGGVNRRGGGGGGGGGGGLSIEGGALLSINDVWIL